MYYHPRYRELREEIERSNDPYYKPDINEELRNITNSVISLESSTTPLKVVKDTFIKILTWIKNMVIKLYHYLKDKLLKWVKGKWFRNHVNLLLLAKKTNHLTDQEFTTIVKSYFINVSIESLDKKDRDELLSYLSSMENKENMNQLTFDFQEVYSLTNRRLSYLLDEKGNLRDINKVMDSVVRFVYYLRDASKTELHEKYGRLLPEHRYSYVEDPSKLFGLMLDDLFGYSVKTTYSRDFVINQKDFYNQVKGIDQLIIYADRKLRDLKQSIEKEYNKQMVILNQIKQNNNEFTHLNNHGDIKFNVDKLKLMLLCIEAPINLLIHFTKLISYISGKVFDKEYISTRQIPSAKLYHLSDNPKLPTLLKPIMPMTGMRQYLPKRISFSPSKENAFFGLSGTKYFKQWINAGISSSDDFDVVDLYRTNLGEYHDK